MSENLYGFKITERALYGYFEKGYYLSLTWFPEYIDSFPSAVKNIQLTWNKCKFISASKSLIPHEHGVYCFSVPMKYPLPCECHIPIYIGKAAPGFLSERFNNYLKEKKNPNGREKIVQAFNKYKDDLVFWWAILPRIYVDMIEEHLLSCYYPPCNSDLPNRDRLWGKAF